MSQTSFRELSWPRLAPLRELLQLWLSLRDISEPLTSPEGLRKTLELIARLGELVGLDESIINRISTLLDNPAALNVVLAIVQYVLGVVGGRSQQGDLRVTLLESREEVVVDSQSLVEWLPLVISLLNLLREIRRSKPSGAV